MTLENISLTFTFLDKLEDTRTSSAAEAVCCFTWRKIPAFCGSLEVRLGFFPINDRCARTHLRDSKNKGKKIILLEGTAKKVFSIDVPYYLDAPHSYFPHLSKSPCTDS